MFLIHSVVELSKSYNSEITKAVCFPKDMLQRSLDEFCSYLEYRKLV